MTRRRLAELNETPADRVSWAAARGETESTFSQDEEEPPLSVKAGRQREAKHREAAVFLPGGLHREEALPRQRVEPEPAQYEKQGEFYASPQAQNSARFAPAAFSQHAGDLWQARQCQQGLGEGWAEECGQHRGNGAFYAYLEREN